MDTTPARDDTQHESVGDDSAQDSDEEKGPGGAPVVKHFTYAGTRIPHWIVKHYPDLVATLLSPGDEPDDSLEDWHKIWSSAIKCNRSTFRLECDHTISFRFSAAL